MHTYTWIVHILSVFYAQIYLQAKEGTQHSYKLS